MPKIPLPLFVGRDRHFSCRQIPKAAWFVLVNEKKLWRGENLEGKSSLTKKLELEKRNDRHLFLQVAIRIILCFKTPDDHHCDVDQVLGLAPLSIVASEVQMATPSARAPQFEVAPKVCCHDIVLCDWIL
jgi:hypothetical protein